MGTWGASESRAPQNPWRRYLVPEGRCDMRTVLLSTILVAFALGIGATIMHQCEVGHESETNRTVREYLAEYHGARWPALEVLVPEGQAETLDQQLSDFDPPSWEELKMEFQADVLAQVQSGKEALISQLSGASAQPDFRAPALNPAEKPISAEKMAELLALSDSFAGPLRDLS